MPVTECVATWQKTMTSVSEADALVCDVLFVCLSHTATICCRLVNRSGLRLSYWTDDISDDGEQGCAYTLNSWEESPLLVDPVEKTVIIPDTQQQAWTYALFLIAAPVWLLSLVHTC